jgi:hypothetical protein
LIYLTQRQWARLYKEVLWIALRITHTKVEQLAWTARDRAQEAVQRACERLLRTDPPGLDTIEDLRRYLVGAMRSELHHAGARAETRREAESAAAVEASTITGGATPSAEAMHLAAAQHGQERTRAAKKISMLRKELEGDRIALATIDLIDNDVAEPEEQARRLAVPVEEIYNARKRRKRAMQRVEAAYRDEEEKSS